jgi:hypothetical protein
MGWMFRLGSSRRWTQLQMFSVDPSESTTSSIGLSPSSPEKVWVQSKCPW